MNSQEARHAPSMMDHSPFEMLFAIGSTPTSSVIMHNNNNNNQSSIEKVPDITEETLVRKEVIVQLIWLHNYIYNHNATPPIRPCDRVIRTGHAAVCYVGLMI
jgi:hypothetical protein